MPLISASDLPTGNLRGADHGATISVILDDSEPGHGPRLHKHPYDETWVVIDGDLTFQAGDQQYQAGPGDIVIVPPDTPHTSSPTTDRDAPTSCVSTPTPRS